MQFYRIKHKPTGLYYKPGKPNLTKHGKVYTSGNNILTVWKERDSIPIDFSKTQYEQFKDRYDQMVCGGWATPEEKVSFLPFWIPKTEFVYEPVNI